MIKFLYGRSNLGKMAILIGLLTTMPLLVLPFYPEEMVYARDFILPATGAVLFGTLLCAKKPAAPDGGWRKNIRSSSLTVLFAWGFGFFIGALPFVISGQLSFIGALFESVSGWTTTGLSVMDVSVTSHIYLFHRSFMQYCGGLGFITMMIMLVHEKQSNNLFLAEGHPDKLMPNIKKTARTIFTMFFAFLILGTAAYALAGMNIFEGLLHTMCALSTGGFSTRLGSIGEYNSVAIEIITLILMLIGTTNFAVLLLAVKGKWKTVIKVSELRFLGVLLLIFIPMLVLSLHFQLGLPLGQSIRSAFVDGISALSTTGYSSMSYAGWPPLAVGLLILLMLIGGGLGSTAGGLKLTRVYLLCRIVKENICKKISPAQKITAPYYTKAQGRTKIDAALAGDTTAFIACYLFLFLSGSLLITVTAGCSLTDAMFEFSSALGTVGLSIGITGPGTDNATLIIEIIGMLMGRLEIFIVLTGIHSGFSILREKAAIRN